MLRRFLVILLLLAFSACATDSVEPLQIIHHENFPISPFKVVPDRFVPFSEYNRLEMRVAENKLAASSNIDRVQKNVEKKMQQRVDLIKSAGNSVLSIVVAFVHPATGQFTPILNGTGFLIEGNGLVITAHHVTANAPADSIISALPKDVAAFLATNNLPITEVVQILKKYELAFIRNDPVRDLALYQSQELKSAPHLNFETAFPAIADGEDAVVLGYPLSNPFLTATRAMIAAHILMPTVGQTTLLTQYKLDGSLNSGNSGGPVISVRTGKVIGMADAKAGSLSQNLDLFRKMPANSEIEIGGIQVIGTMRTMVEQMEQQIYYGIGFAISSDYFSELLGHKQIAQAK